MVNLLPAILFGGPPHAGKSVLFYSLAKTLREHGIPHHAIRACPDGEGNWFHELDQDKVRLIRVKGKWTDDFVRQVSLDVEHRHFPLLVDMGGRPTMLQTTLFNHCTHSLLLLRSDDQVSANVWRQMVKERGLLPLAELSSDLYGMSTVISEKPVIKGTLTGLERGSKAHGPLFDLLVERIELLFSSYSLDELEKTKLALAPAELVINLDMFLHAWKPNSNMWERDIIPRLLAELPSDTPLAVYGPGPNWLYGALAAHCGQQTFYQFDPRIGWVAPPPLRICPETMPDVLTLQYPYENATVLTTRIISNHLDYLQADLLPFPPVPTERGLILDGRIPHWLLTALVRAYREVGIPWVACRQIQLEGAVIVTSYTKTYEPGDLIPLPHFTE